MINELYNLSKAMNNAGVEAKTWHEDYKPIPSSKQTPCIRISILDGKVTELSYVEDAPNNNLKGILRKFGDNQGTYPCMNLAPLYRVTSEDIKEEIKKIRDHPEELDDEKIKKIKNWCQDNNWINNLQNKYKNSIGKANILIKLSIKYEPLNILIEESNYFADLAVFHQELENTVFRMLDSKENIPLALDVLFHLGNPSKKAKDDKGSLSIAFETPRLLDMGVPAVSGKFVDGLNSALLSSESKTIESDCPDYVDAFGIPFSTIGKTMPEVTLPGGFKVTLRTMFEEQKCQTRYGRIGNESYLLSPQMRKELKASFEWIGDESKENITWIKTGEKEILFAYPALLPETPVSYVKMFRRPEKKDISFSQQAEKFIKEFTQSKKSGTHSAADRIQLFIMKKLIKLVQK